MANIASPNTGGSGLFSAGSQAGFRKQLNKI